MPRQFCPGIFWFRFAAVALRRIGAHFLMIHTLLSAVHLDLEFISSPAKLCKAQTDNRLHVVKAHFQYGIFSNACFLLCYLPLLVTNGSGSLSGCRKQQCKKKIYISIASQLSSPHAVGTYSRGQIGYNTDDFAEQSLSPVPDH